MIAPTFNELVFGATFTFASEGGVDGLMWQGARGPWIKVGASTYRALVNGEAQGPTHRVGKRSVRVWKAIA